MRQQRRELPWITRAERTGFVAFILRAFRVFAARSQPGYTSGNTTHGFLNALRCAMKTAVIISRHPVLARGLESIASSVFQMAGIFESLGDLRNRAPNAQPDVLVVEMGSLAGPELWHDLEAASRFAPSVVWIDTIPVEFASRCVSLGIRGFLPKSASPEMHVQCLREVAAGGSWLDHELNGKMAEVMTVYLTRGERQVLGLLVRGLRNKELASALNISVSTVKVHLYHLFAKAGVRDRFDLALLALKNIAFWSEVPDVDVHANQRGNLTFPDALHLRTDKSPNAPGMNGRSNRRSAELSSIDTRVRASETAEGAGLLDTGSAATFSAVTSTP